MADLQTASQATNGRLTGMPHATASDGTRLAYQVRGEGRPLVLLAGQSNNHHWWDPVRSDFERDRRTITLDYRGTGDSDRPDEPYSTEGFAADVIAVLDDLDVESADVYGTSMGGRVAQWLAIRHPERVEGLVLGCTSPGRSHGFERSQEIRRALAQGDKAARDLVLLDLMYTGLAGGESRPVLRARRRQHARVRPRQTPCCEQHHDAWDDLPSIKARTLILHRSDDVFSPPANVEVLADRIPDACAEVISGARHAYFHEFHTIATPLALDFLNSGKSTDATRA